MPTGALQNRIESHSLSLSICNYLLNFPAFLQLLSFCLISWTGILESKIEQLDVSQYNQWEGRDGKSNPVPNWTLSCGNVQTVNLGDVASHRYDRVQKLFTLLPARSRIIPLFGADPTPQCSVLHGVTESGGRLYIFGGIDETGQSLLQVVMSDQERALYFVVVFRASVDRNINHPFGPISLVCHQAVNDLSVFRISERSLYVRPSGLCLKSP